jgi:tRNA dimethylallyltransferase
MKSTSISDGRTDVPALLVLAGPTASGKTRTGVALTQALDGEIVSVDARQVYRYMDIGTAKATPEEQVGARHHMIDVVGPDEPYSAGRYAREAAAAIRDVQRRGRLPILVGGSGFYLEALLDGFSPIPEIPSEVRSRLLKEARDDLPVLYQRLSKVDPKIAQRLHPHDSQRVVRALEVFEATGERLSDLQKRPREGRWEARWFGLDMDRARLYGRIEARVDRMLEAGLVDEVESLRKRGYGPGLNALNTFGYREIFAVLDGDLDLETAVDQIKVGTRQYARRQLTWFRRESRLTWIDPTSEDAATAILKRLDRPGKRL